MVELSALWLPILLSAVAVFVVSSVVHMVLKWHMSDYGRIPDEAKLLVALREQGLQRGGYFFPYCGDMKEMGSAEMKEKFERGPVGFMTILPSGPMAMGKHLLQWFLYTILVGVFVAYLGTLAAQPGAGFMDVFRVTATASMLGYAVAPIVDAIWKSVAWSTTAKFIVDGILYALATGAVFGWMWPGA